MAVVQTGGFGEDLYYLDNSHFGFNIYPSIGMYYKVNMPGESERLYFQYEGTYSFIDLTTSNVYVEPLYNMTFYNDINWTQNIFNNVVLLKYEFPNGKIKPTFQIGGFIRYSFISKYTKNLHVINSLGNTYNKSQTDDSPFSKFDYGINCGIGFISTYINEKELFLDIRYQRGFGIVQHLNTNSLTINVGFQIGK